VFSRPPRFVARRAFGGRDGRAARLWVGAGL
jgi:hypothetical protein